MIQPLKDYVLIEPLEERAGALLIPDSAKEKPHRGKVLTTGTEEVKVGQIVVFKKWGGNEIKVDGKDCVLIKVDEILGVEI